MSTRVRPALIRSLRAVQLDGCDEAAAKLAVRLAEAIDSGDEPVWHIAPRLLAVLAELGMTPSARRAATIALGRSRETSHEPVPKSPLDELRARRAARTG